MGSGDTFKIGVTFSTRENMDWKVPNGNKLSKLKAGK